MKPQRPKGQKSIRDVDYKVVCISTYDGDLALLDQHVEELRARGYRRASRSMVVRLAVRMLDTRNVAPTDEVASRITSTPLTAQDIAADQQSGVDPVERLGLFGEVS